MLVTSHCSVAGLSADGTLVFEFASFIEVTSILGVPSPAKISFPFVFLFPLFMTFWLVRTGGRWLPLRDFAFQGFEQVLVFGHLIDQVPQPEQILGLHSAKVLVISVNLVPLKAVSNVFNVHFVLQQLPRFLWKVHEVRTLEDQKCPGPLLDTLNFSGWFCGWYVKREQFCMII